jgi:hypothetical protein
MKKDFLAPGVGPDEAVPLLVLPLDDRAPLLHDFGVGPVKVGSQWEGQLPDSVRLTFALEHFPFKRVSLDRAFSPRLLLETIPQAMPEADLGRPVGPIL